MCVTVYDSDLWPRLVALKLILFSSISNIQVSCIFSNHPIKSVLLFVAMTTRVDVKYKLQPSSSLYSSVEGWWFLLKKKTIFSLLFCRNWGNLLHSSCQQVGKITTMTTWRSTTWRSSPNHRNEPCIIDYHTF